MLTTTHHFVENPLNGVIFNSNGNAKIDSSVSATTHGGLNHGDEF
jgi:hypothetical protein